MCLISDIWYFIIFLLCGKTLILSNYKYWVRKLLFTWILSHCDFYHWENSKIVHVWTYYLIQLWHYIKSFKTVHFGYLSTLVYYQHLWLWTIPLLSYCLELFYNQYPHPYIQDQPGILIQVYDLYLYY